ncbi:MAG: transporter substrate-binding domain-containing protein [Alphaproteobacteria bacterium]|nr:transporter substrate-binding domain-containing protein [Alphaproteobacteria bacterium]
MNRQIIALLAILIVSLAAPVGADIKFLTHSLEDAVYRDAEGTLHGHKNGGRRAFYVETVRAIMRQRGVEIPISEVPLSRGLSLVENDGEYALFNIIRNPERKDKFKWVGPISETKTFFFEHADRPTGIRNFEDAKTVNVLCVVRGNNIVIWFKNQNFTNLVTANSKEACVQMLEYGRADLIYNSEHQPWPVAAERSVKLVNTGVQTQDPNAEPDFYNLGYVAFSKTIPDTEIARWQAALDAIKASGEFARLKETYLILKPAGQ